MSRMNARCVRLFLGRNIQAKRLESQTPDNIIWGFFPRKSVAGVGPGPRLRIGTYPVPFSDGDDAGCIWYTP